MKVTLVPMPKKKIGYKKKPSGIIYVYYTVRAYRNAKGNPTSDEVLIGKKDKETGKLIPNNRFYEYFPEYKSSEQTTEPKAKSTSNAIHKIKCCGEYTLMLEVAKQTGLYSVLQKCFPLVWEELLVVAMYMISQGKAISYIEDWFDESNIDLIKSINDVRCSRLFESLTFAGRQLFFTEWAKYRSELEHIYFDVTSISTSCKSNSLAEMGYNRDNDKIPQVNCGMFIGKTSNLPIYYDMYSGSVPDKTHLEYMMKCAKDIGVENVSFVLDRGFESKENYSYMLANNYSFITAMPECRIKAKELIDKVHSNIDNMENWIVDYNVFGIRESILIEGHELQAHIYFSNSKKDDETIDYKAYIDKLQYELEKISISNKIPKRYKDHFIIEEQSKKTFTYKLDYTKINAELKRLGYFVLLTNNKDITSTEMIQMYRSKDVVEKHFDQLKNDLDFKRLRTHKQKTAEGKLFVGFLALILRSYMLNVIKNDKQTKQLTFEKVLIELKKIKSVVMSDMKESLITLNNLQKIILNVFNVKKELLLC